MSDSVAKIDTFVVTLPRDDPYLGKLGAGETVNERGYFVRSKSRTVYTIFDRSVLVRIETRNGVVGWGETYGLVAPRATTEIINDFLSGFTIGRDPQDVVEIHDDLYNLNRVRGYSGGFYMDAVAAIDIALWDIAAKQRNVAVAELIGGEIRRTIPAYVSGLPRPTLDERVEFAGEWVSKGFASVKFAAPVANDGVVNEMAALRQELGPAVRIACDMHWMNSADEAIRLIRDLEAHDLWFAEAPVNSEDISGLAIVGNNVSATIAVGEEWRTAHDAALRLDHAACGILQPEMGHTGITEFLRIAELACNHRIELIPHATIGLGVFLAASLQTSSTIGSCSAHEYQHSVFDRNIRYAETDMHVHNGRYTSPSGAGLGVTPDLDALSPYLS